MKIKLFVLGSLFVFMGAAAFAEPTTTTTLMGETTTTLLAPGTTTTTTLMGETTTTLLAPGTTTTTIPSGRYTLTVWPPYEDYAAFVQSDAGLTPNGKALIDPLTGKVWLAMALEDTFRSRPTGYAAIADFRSSQISANDEDRIQADVLVEIPTASVIRNNRCSNGVWLEIVRADNRVIKRQYFPLAASVSLVARRFSISTDTPPGAGNYYVNVQVEVLAYDGGLGAVGNGLRVKEFGLYSFNKK